MVYATGREFHGPSYLFLFLLDLDDLTALVMPATKANPVWQAHLATVRAGNQVVAY
jgi:hypothetical protein